MYSIIGRTNKERINKERINKNKRNVKRKKINFDLFEILILLISIFGIMFILLIILSLFIKLDILSLKKVLLDISTYKAVYLTIVSLLISMFIVLIIGIPISYYLSRKKGKIIRILDVLISIPILIPPAIAGIALLSTFGKKGLLSGLINKFNLSIALSFSALVIVQVFVTLPIFIQMLKEGFNDIDKAIVEAALIDGAQEKDIMFFIYVPIAIKHLLSGLILGFLRSAGEFGATIMFAGNLSGKTQTMTTLIYTLSQNSLNLAIALAVLHIFIFIIPFFLLKLKINY